MVLVPMPKPSASSHIVRRPLATPHLSPPRIFGAEAAVHEGIGGTAAGKLGGAEGLVRGRVAGGDASQEHTLDLVPLPASQQIRKE